MIKDVRKIESGYDVAQICLNGHMINSSTQRSPEFNQRFCHKCGAATINACPKCNTSLRGRYYTADVLIWYDTPVHSFCHQCGAPYPWTEASLQAAEELIELSSIPDEEKESLKTDMPALMSDTPRTKVAIAKAKTFMSKAGPELASAFRDIVVDIGSEVVKKALFPDI